MQKVLDLKNVSKIYSETKNITNFLSKNDDTFVAVDNVSFSLEAKKVLDVEDVVTSIFLVEDLRVIKN